MKQKTIKRLETIERIKPEREPTFIHFFPTPVGIAKDHKPSDEEYSAAQAKAIAQGHWWLHWHWTGEKWMPEETFQ